MITLQRTQPLILQEKVLTIDNIKISYATNGITLLINTTDDLLPNWNYIVKIENYTVSSSDAFKDKLDINGIWVGEVKPDNINQIVINTNGANTQLADNYKAIYGRYSNNINDLLIDNNPYIETLIINGIVITTQSKFNLNLVGKNSNNKLNVNIADISVFDGASIDFKGVVNGLEVSIKSINTAGMGVVYFETIDFLTVGVLTGTANTLLLCDFGLQSKTTNVENRVAALETAQGITNIDVLATKTDLEAETLARTTADATKIGKVLTAIDDNIALFDATGQVKDNGYKINDSGTTNKDILTAVGTKALIQDYKYSYVVKGNWDALNNQIEAGGGALPLAPDSNYKNGDFYNVSVGGTFNGIEYTTNDIIIAIFDRSGVGSWMRENWGMVASEIEFANANTGLNATNTQEVIVEVNNKIDASATIQYKTGFDNFTNHLTYIDINRVISINFTSPYKIWVKSKSYICNADKQKQITNDVGWHTIYFDVDVNGTIILQDVFNQTQAQLDALLLDYTVIASVYWNGSQFVIPLDNRKPAGDAMQHINNRQINGCKYIDGLDIAMNINGDGTSDDNMQFSCTGGIINNGYNQTIEAKGISDNMQILYKNGSGDFTYSLTSYNTICLVGANGRPQYNNGNALAEIDNNKFGVAHIYALPHIDATNRYIAIMGNGQYATQNEAIVVAQSKYDIGILPDIELTKIYSIVFEVQTTYTNNVKSRAVAKYDWRTTNYNQNEANCPTLLTQASINQEIIDRNIAIEFASPTQLNVNQLYVSPAGGDANNGQVNRKKKTIQNALDTLVGQSSATIECETGTYPESLILGNSSNRFTILGNLTERNVSSRAWLFNGNNGQMLIKNWKFDNATGICLDFQTSYSSATLTGGNHTIDGFVVGGNVTSSIAIQVGTNYGGSFLTLTNGDCNMKMIVLADLPAGQSKFLFLTNWANTIISAGTGWAVIKNLNCANVIEASSNNNILDGFMANGAISSDIEYNYIVSLGALGNGYYLSNYTKAGVFSQGDIILRQNPVTLVDHKHYNAFTVYYVYNPVANIYKTYFKKNGIWNEIKTQEELKAYFDTLYATIQSVKGVVINIQHLISSNISSLSGAIPTESGGFATSGTCLLEGQTIKKENGIYDVVSGVWTRRTISLNNTTIKITEGTSINKEYYASMLDIIYGTSDIEFTELTTTNLMQQINNNKIVAGANITITQNSNGTKTIASSGGGGGSSSGDALIYSANVVIDPSGNSSPLTANVAVMMNSSGDLYGVYNGTSAQYNVSKTTFTYNSYTPRSTWATSTTGMTDPVVVVNPNNPLEFSICALFTSFQSYTNAPGMLSYRVDATTNIATLVSVDIITSNACDMITANWVSQSTHNGIYVMTYGVGSNVMSIWYLYRASSAESYTRIFVNNSNITPIATVKCMRIGYNDTSFVSFLYTCGNGVFYRAVTYWSGGTITYHSSPNTVLWNSSVCGYFDIMPLKDKPGYSIGVITIGTYAVYAFQYSYSNNLFAFDGGAITSVGGSNTRKFRLAQSQDNRTIILIFTDTSGDTTTYDQTLLLKYMGFSHTIGSQSIGSAGTLYTSSALAASLGVIPAWKSDGSGTDFMIITSVTSGYQYARQLITDLVNRTQFTTGTYNQIQVNSNLYTLGLGYASNSERFYLIGGAHANGLYGVIGKTADIVGTTNYDPTKVIGVSAVNTAVGSVGSAYIVGFYPYASAVHKTLYYINNTLGNITTTATGGTLFGRGVGGKGIFIDSSFKWAGN